MLPRRKFRFNRTTLITVGLASFLIGIALGKFHVAIYSGWVVVAVIFLLIFYRKRRFTALAAVLICGLALGIWRGHAFVQNLDPYQELYDHKVVLQVVANEDASYTKNSQLGFEASHIRVIEPIAIDLPGRLKIAGFGESMVYHGDVVQVEGRLRTTLGGRQGQMSFAVLHTLVQHSSFIDTTRRNFAAGMQNALPEPVASFGLGILIGQRYTLPAVMTTVLATVGLTHLIAVSGYNLTIIVDTVRRLTGKRSKYQSALFAVTLIALFLLMTGLSASIVRAAIVSGLTILAWYYGRTIKPLLLILLVAAVTAGWNPLYLWGDIGWYLSFLAFFGVLIIAPFLSKRIYKDKEPRLISSVLLETLSAQIMTLPLILYIFQQISFISIISNVMIVPLVPIAMLLSLIAGMAGMWIPAIAGWLAWPAKVLLTYMLDVASLLSKAPHALAHYGLSLTGLIILYGAIVLCVIILWRKTQKRFEHGTITDIESNSRI